MTDGKIKQITDIVYGNSAGPNIKEKIESFIFSLCFVRAFNAPLNPQTINRRLKTIGYSDDDQYKIREVFVSCSKISIDRIQRKFTDSIPPHYVAAGPDWYGAYQLFLNVDEKYHVLFRELVKKLFVLKLRKLEL